MIGVTVHQRKPRSEQQYETVQPKKYRVVLVSGIRVRIDNLTEKPLYLKWRI
jgi:hypothetical protein